MVRTRAPSPAGGIPALVGLLIVVFCIAGLLVYEAWSTGQSRREIADRGLQDYAAYATWSTARTGDAVLSTSLATLFRGVVGARVSHNAPLPPLSVLERDVVYLNQCDCALVLPAEYYFRADLRTGAFTAIASPANPAPLEGYAAAKVGSFAPRASSQLPTIARGQEIVRVLMAATIPATGDFTVIFTKLGDSARVIGVAPQRDSAGTMAGAFGFVASPGEYARTLIAHLWRLPRILPISVTRGMPSDSLLTALVSTPVGKEIYRSNGWSSGLVSDTASIGAVGGGMRLTIALRRDAVARLTGGLVPASRVPVWVGLLLLTGLLTAIILRNLQREHELTRLRADFTASVSHELRTPLAQIMLFGETLTLGRARSEMEKTRAAEVIVREAQRLMQLVENTLQFARAQRPMTGLSPEPLRLAPIVEDIVTGFEPLAAARQVHLTTELDKSAQALVDRSAFRQMLINLLDNALKYGPAAQTIGVGVTVRNASDSATNGADGGANRVIQVWVEDEGPGIFGRRRENIWEPFVRGDHDSAATGCGLGLAVVRELASRHGGRAWVGTPYSGNGSRFVIELPAVHHSSLSVPSAPSAVA